MSTVSRGVAAVGVLLFGVGLLWAGSSVASSAPSGSRESSVPSGDEASRTPRDTATVTWMPEVVPEGTIFQIGVQAMTGDIEQIVGRFAGESLHFRPTDAGGYVSLAAAPVDLRGEVPVELEIAYASGSSQTLSVDLPVVEGDYRMERLSVAPEFGSPLPPELEARTDEEYARAMAVARAAHDTPRMWDLPFVPPRTTRVTSGFGQGRVFNDEVTSRHMGTDFAGAVGESVRAPARGRVVLVDQFYYGGNVIYLDHGAGLLTGYLHLSEQDVREGDLVEPGQIIGLVGATGRVTGPHLHWIVRYGETTVDGTSLLALE